VIGRGTARAALGLALAALAIQAPAASASTFTADRLTDDPPDGCAVNGCTLREAILAANAHPGPDVVSMQSGRYVLSITGTGEDAGLTGDLDVRGPVTIAGQGAKETRIDAQPIGISAPDGGDRVFDLHGGDVTMRGFRTDNSEVHGNGGGVRATGRGSLLLTGVRIADATGARGGGIYSDRHYSLQVVNSRVDDNHAGGGGGGIFSLGSLTMKRSAADDNHARSNGGSIFAAGRTMITHSGVHDSHADRRGGAIVASGRLTISASVIHDSHAQFDGGGIYLGGHATRDSISRTTFTSLDAGGEGGAIFAVGPKLGITNSTIAYSAAQTGGGAISVLSGRVLLNASTIAHNSSAHGPAGGLLGVRAPLAMRNTIVAANLLGRHRVSDCAGPIRSKGHNLSGFHCAGLGAPGDIRTRHPLLGQLGRHGGPNQTIALRAGSPAINAGGPGCPRHDQRGYGRRGRCDIGAFEFNGLPGG
jgi:fibronectin-binding autotransporter adhesin